MIVACALGIVGLLSGLCVSLIHARNGNPWYFLIFMVVVVPGVTLIVKLLKKF